MDLTKRFRYWCINILLLSCMIGIAFSQHTCVSGLAFQGYTIPPGDIEIEYGNPLDIMCVLHNNSKLKPNASQFLTFRRRNEIIPSEMIEIVNSTAIRLHIDKPPKVSEDTYTCLMEGGQAVCSNLVAVGTKPQPVTDFKCIGYNYDNLTCTWTRPENYIETDYKLTYSLLGRASRHTFGCPSLQYNDIDHTASCFWNISTTPHYRQVHESYYFRLEMKNKFGENQLEETFSHFAHVLSGPPENLTVVNVTSSSIFLCWMVPHSMKSFSPGLHHRIIYQCEYDEKKWRFGGKITHQPNASSKCFNLTNLKHAYTLCDIRVSLRSAKALENDESMWSQNSSITYRTGSKVPDEPPKTVIGSFEIVAAGGNLEHRDAYIYWQQIPEEQKNGPKFNYSIAVEGNPSLQPIDLSNAYAKFKNLSVSRSYTFKIWSVNVDGPSLRKSTVYIPEQTRRIKEPKSFTKVEFGDGKYELSWETPKLPDGLNITNYTIFWCSNERDRPHQCTGKLNWTVVSPDKNVYNATVGDDKIYQFAISTNTDAGSSGMLWAACTILPNRNMGKIKDVWIEGVGSTYITVRWNLDCADRIGSVDGFIIYYCPIKSPFTRECKGSQKSVKFGNSNIGNVTNLIPNTIYILNVAIITKHGTYSPPSEQLENTTMEAAPSSPPQNFKITNVTNSSISLSWTPPTEMNGKLKFYEIRYNNSTQEVDDGTYFTLMNLRSYENYSISIRACTVACSDRSIILNATTKLGYPSKIGQPTLNRSNGTSITIGWPEAAEPNGRNEYYIVKLIQKHNKGNVTQEFNVSNSKYVLENCGDGGKYNTFYLSVRAVNVDKNETYKGPWSDELESYCYATANYIIYILLVAVFAFFILMAFLFNRLYKHCQVMRDVQVKLPPGLDIISNHTFTGMPTEKEPIPRDYSPSDQHRLLPRVEQRGSEGTNVSGDSSGCSSGHASVNSYSESGPRISSSSDSGTEQPETYCVLGVDPKIDSAYVPVSADSTNKPPYKTCDVSNEPSPYVMTGDAVKTINPGYIPFNQTEPIGKSSGYVVAGGIKNYNGYIPFNQTETVNRNTGYVVAGVKNCKLD